ncbi:MAG: aspartate/glutamate racemase family protein [Reyranella sp.]|uniref:aspartate/glutamate racemase family protein n=1 Tax=Reyranella sp. TaxID=1929291 RepID=UPI00273193ED|nr:aspartate/glutamate racemase family protein [Reyranella sp.]MDP1963414.1 aspartate/glutamate racemase family protein [Reyranella sp.]MDP2375953.1 aspartate/glutamate racemase family protein [Reyranella sp.]
MKILVANPNTSTGVTDRLVAAGRLVASPGTELMAMTAPRGVPYIATRAEAAIGSAVMLEMLAERRGTFDAAIVAAFGDPGLGGARELFDFPVVGMAEAAMLVACTLGRKFAIVSFAKALEPWFAEIVEWHGLSGRCAAIRTLDEAFRSIDDVQTEKEQVLIDLALGTVKNDGADVVILAGAPLAGLANKIRERVPVPLVDGIQAAVTMAEGLVRLNPRKATAGTYRRPAAKDSKGLSQPLADVIGHRDA